ncbi:class I adenylate-forming enzyme family protein [Streptomyces sp. NPDC060184]|uniref:class I adenylate-forming enzyme family protein n=1 Tax=Streptomyces sp. NPDC060184 TaxID=3347064 RepID=UPI0036510163
MHSQGIFAAVAASSPTAALITADRTWTRDELLAAAEDLSERLGLHAPGGVVFAELVDAAATAVVTFAADRAGLFVVHRDPGATADSPRSGPVVRDSPLSSGPGQVTWTAPSGDVTLAISTTSTDGSTPHDDLLSGGAQIFLTSGSTAAPSAVVRRAAAVLADARRVARALDYAPDAPVVCAAPLFHAYGFNYGLVAPLLAGAPVRVLPGRSLPSQCAAAARELGARTLIALPAHYRLLATGSGQGHAARGLDRLGAAVSAGAPLPQALLDRSEDGLGFPLYNCYGSSEAGAVTLTRVAAGQEPGDIGEPLPGIKARIEDGELWIHTSSLALGRAEPNTLAGFAPLAGPDGWYRTGDLARRDPTASGRLRLLGRAATVINVAGEKVAPAEVEEMIARCEGVLDVQVSAASDPVRGQVPTARVVLRPSVTERQLVAWCRARLAPQQMPRRFEIVEWIARSATGKPLAEPGPQESL